jgi:hypothetical protein
VEKKRTTAIPSGEADLSEYGRNVDLMSGGPGVTNTAGPDFDDRYTQDPLIDVPGHLGLSFGPGLPVDVHRMERHHHTSEAVFCLDGPVILPVAAPTHVQPRTRDVQALLISPGECVILKPNVWHAHCIGVDGPAAYYWLAAVDHTLPADWVELDDGPVGIELVESSLP